MADRGSPQMQDSRREVVLRVRGLEVSFGERRVLHGLDLDLYRGEILGVVGASGTGKSVLMRTILGLVPKSAGSIELFGQDVDVLSAEARRELELRLGVLFQFGALFSSLTVRENIQLNLSERLELSEQLLEEVTMLKLHMVGLAPETADKLPSELSGGMIKRAALARALALDPEILFLDEPTSGLDPIGAGEFDQLITTLRGALGLTVFMVTHDLDSLYTVCDRIAAIGSGHIIAAGDIEAMLDNDDPWLRAYFRGKRARAVAAAEQGKTRQGVGG
ncbi:phospholipid/cholesterol/gamma-HCH transport system ATP-binding protein [Rhizobiales bacterium GAS113]|nr:phospholipid/cholesterol/gamma-HCH transport system ATP-binding protein [Rhizobiales bacterium GAS113]